LQQELKDDLNRKDIFIEIDPSANALDIKRDQLPRCCVTFFDGFSVRLFDEIRPCGADVGEGTVVRSVVDQQTDIVITCLVGVSMVELTRGMNMCVLSTTSVLNTNTYFV
jgi:hypothetical protein